MIPYMVGKLAPNSSHLTRGLVKSVPGRGYFRAVPSQNGDKYVTSPPPQSLNLSSKRLDGITGCKYKTSSWHLNGFPDGNNIGSTVYNVGEKPTGILYTYINRHAGTPENSKNKTETM